MTRQHNTSRRPRVRKIAGAVVVVTAAWTSLVDGNVEASRRTKSAVVAAEAERAVEALDRWTVSQSPIDYVRFVQSRDLTASLTESEIDIETGSLSDEWAAAPVSKQHAVLSAVSQLGVPYRSIASEPGVGFDCSGLTIWAFGEAGIELPRVSHDQIDAATTIDREDAKPGDLVYYPGHVSIFLGAGLMVHSPETGSHVEVTWLPEKSLRFGTIVSEPVEFAPVWSL